MAQNVSSVFDRYWNSELAYPVSALVDTPPTPEQVEEKSRQLRDFIAGQADSAYLSYNFV